MFELKGKLAVITGGAKGIGATAVQSFFKEGAKFVAFVDIDATSGNALELDLINKYGANSVKFFKCDITRDEELFDVFNYTVKNYGYIDVVLNNAGIANDVAYKKEIEINFTAVVTSSLKALQIMRKDQGGKGGTIINVSSVGALNIQKDYSLYVYCATKSAVLLFGANLGLRCFLAFYPVEINKMESY